MSMGIYIRGMQMPKSCADCPICYDQMECPISGLRFWRGRPESKEFNFTDERHPDCPLSPDPPHGDLIERKAVYLTDFEIAMCNGDYKEGMKMLLDKIESAPTIIPAEEGK
jgi:hypothetical protein